LAPGDLQRQLGVIHHAAVAGVCADIVIAPHVQAVRRTGIDAKTAKHALGVVDRKAGHHETLERGHGLFFVNVNTVNGAGSGTFVAADAFGQIESVIAPISWPHRNGFLRILKVLREWPTTKGLHKIPECHIQALGDTAHSPRHIVQPTSHACIVANTSAEPYNNLTMLPDGFAYQNLRNDLARDLLAIAPELLVGGGIVLVLLTRLFGIFNELHRITTGLTITAAALGLAIQQYLALESSKPAGAIFTGLLHFDHWAIGFRVLILAAAAGTLLVSRFTGLVDIDDSGDFAAMLLGSTLGLLLMASADHWLMIFLAMEMASLPGYALAGFLKGRATASEAALKYALFGAAASGTMLYGISLLIPQTGSGSLLATADMLTSMLTNGTIIYPFAVALLLIAMGLAYKLSVAPLHVWLPDVFEGAAAEVAMFLSIASKMAAVALIVRIVYTTTAFVPALATVIDSLGLTLAILGAATATLGNVLAYAQTNLNRLLGYSTIAHAGLLLAGLATVDARGASATVIYLIAYMFANLAAFATIAAVRIRTGREDIAALSGLLKACPWLGIGLIIAFGSLLGLPPLAGFTGKFLVFQAISDTAAASPAMATAWWIIFAVLLANTALAAGYYLNLIRLASLEEPLEAVRDEPQAIHFIVAFLGVASIAAGIAWGPMTGFADTVSASWK
jgi:NADH-quinone oxidoreductase subunit N